MIRACKNCKYFQADYWHDGGACAEVVSKVTDMTSEHEPAVLRVQPDFGCILFRSKPGFIGQLMNGTLHNDDEEAAE